MLTAALFAAALLTDGGQVAVIAGTPPPAETRRAPAGSVHRLNPRVDMCEFRCSIFRIFEPDTRHVLAWM